MHNPNRIADQLGMSFDTLMRIGFWIVFGLILALIVASVFSGRRRHL